MALPVPAGDDARERAVPEHQDAARGAAEAAPWDLKTIVAQLRDSREHTHKVRHLGHVRELPSRQVLASVVDGLRAALFPTHLGATVLTDESIDGFVGHTLATALQALAEQLRRGLVFDHPDLAEDVPAQTERANVMARDFAHQLPALRALAVSDLHAAYQGDPAASNLSEILLCYPGTAAILLHRMAHALHALGARLVPRMISEIAHERTGVEIHPGARIGASFFIDHGSGVVIGETTIVGERVRLYQAVTLGAKRFPVDAQGNLIKGIARHPIVEDDVVIYAGATILGRITIGRGSNIGGNVWVTHDVPPGSNLSQAQMRSDPQNGTHKDNP
jgi:serine O-acetyltransferase